jgi:myosin heavy subunit
MQDVCDLCAQSTDLTFGDKLRQQLKDHACFGFDPRIPSLDFIVHHYAGDVLYSCDKFLDKNRDSLSPGAATTPPCPLFVLVLTCGA